MQAVRAFLFEQRGFRLPHFGRSNIPAGCTVDSPGDPKIFNKIFKGFIYLFFIDFFPF